MSVDETNISKPTEYSKNMLSVNIYSSKVQRWCYMCVEGILQNTPRIYTDNILIIYHENVLSGVKFYINIPGTHWVACWWLGKVYVYLCNSPHPFMEWHKDLFRRGGWGKFPCLTLTRQVKFKLRVIVWRESRNETAKLRRIWYYL